jgi:PAS domain S-box-containing protein
MAFDHDTRLAAVILENALEYAIFTMDFDGVITAWSRGAEQMLGYTRGEAVGMSFSVLFVAPDREAGNDAVELEKAKRDGKAEDTRWHQRKNGQRFWANGMTMRIEEPGVSSLLKILRDETPAKLADDQRVLLLNELNHRIKNTLATVQSIAEQTLRASDADPVARRNLTERLIALSEAHNVLVEENWAGADLMSIVRQALAPHDQPGQRRFQINGPPVWLSSQQAVAMALALHELATNAIKYGALARDGGRVVIEWTLSHDHVGARHMAFLWRESGGPPVGAPDHQGFGTRLIARSFGQESDGEARIAFLPEGVQCVIKLPLSIDGEIPPLRL